MISNNTQPVLNTILGAVCGLAVLLSFNATASADMTGTWQTTIGQANLEQQGGQILGTLMKNGQAYLVKGTMTGNIVQMSLSINGEVKHYIENVTLNSFGNQGSGTVRSTGGSGLMSAFSMTAQTGQGGGQGGGGGFTPAFNIAGSWTSSLGPVSMTQTDNKVRGELRFNNGVVAVMNGTIVNRDFNFQWGIEGQVLGSGSLHLSQDQKSLKGTYVDNRVGHNVSLSMTRSFP